MKITKKWAISNNACQGGVDWLLGQKETDGEKLVAKVMSHNLDWANWLVVRLMTHKQQIKYAIYAAKQVIDIYERKYPEDKRPRLAIEAAENYLKNPSATNADNAAAKAAYAAAYAAAVAKAAKAAKAANAAAYAGYAAKAVAYSAYAVAYAANADNAAAYAAKAVAYSAYAVAYAAKAANAADAAESDMKRGIILYGLKLLTKKDE